MPQFFVPKKNFQKNRFFFNPQESRHLIKVLRKKSGDPIQIFDGEGGVFNARLTSTLNEQTAEGEIESVLKPARNDLERNICIYPSLIKGIPFEWMLEKLTELGINSIQPFISERTVIQLTPTQAISKLKRWEKIVLSSAKQCGRSSLPKIFPALPLDQALEQAHGKGHLLFFWEGEEKQNLRDMLPKLKEDRTQPIHLFIGPEGGFTPKEAEFAQKKGAISLRLGESILRAETAAIAATSTLLLS